MKQWTIQPGEEGQRLDKYLRNMLKAAPLSLIFRLLRTKKIKVNGKKADPSLRLDAGSTLSVYFNDEELAKLIAESKERRNAHVRVVKPTFTVLYEDDDILVVNKPAGVASHSGTGTGENTMINQVLTYLGFTGEGAKASLIHRLDKDTSGTLLIGKNRKATALLGEQLASKGFHKEYLALLDGLLQEDSGTIKNTLAKSSAPERTMRATLDTEGGKEAETKYVVEHRFPDVGATLVRLQLLTGRTHQIRTHMADLGHPLLGDDRYGNFARNRAVAKSLGIKRQFLHAHRLQFLHPRSGKPMTIEAPLPADLTTTLTLLGHGKTTD